MILPTVPGVVDGWEPLPFMPGLREATALEDMLGPCGNHELFGDWHLSVLGKFLAGFLLACVDSKM